MKVFVTGGTGFLGLNLIQTLITKNVEISCLIQKDLPFRKPAIYRNLIAWNVNLKSGDITNYNDVYEALDDNYDYVFHLAGIVASKYKENYERINVNGTRNLLQGIQKADINVQRLIYMSTISAMGAIKSDRPLNEEVTPKPVTSYEVSKYKGEQLVEKFHKENRIPTTIARAPMIYGYGEHSGMLKLAKVIVKGIIPVFSDKASLPIVYVKNLVDGLILCAEKSRKPFDIYIISDAKTYTFTEIEENIAENLKIKPLRLKMPMDLLKIAAAKIGYLRYVANNVRLSIDKAIKELEYKPKDCLKKGLKETVQYHVLQGLLKCGNYPLSPFDTLDIGLKEEEGLGTAYEYYVKTRILTRYLKKAHKVEKALIISLPRIHGSVADIVAALNELGINFATMKISDEESVNCLWENFDVIIVVGDFLKNTKKIVSLLGRHSNMVILFTANANNLFHFKKWSGTSISQILDASPTLYNYLDCPPFPSGVKMFAGKKAKETTTLKTLMLMLAFWNKIEWNLPTTVKSKLSHMTTALYCKAGG